MKRKLFVLFLFALSLCRVHAQSLNNIYDDVLKIHTIRNGGKPFASAIQAQTLKIVAKYFPSNTSDLAIVQALAHNPIIQANSSVIGSDSLVFNFYALAGLVAAGSNGSSDENSANLYSLQASSGAAGIAGPGFSATAIADELTQLIIERAKEELTATFFQRLKDLLQNNPELAAAFPKTTTFIGQIETYLYASYLPTLREAFLSDVYGLPMQLGEILSSPRVKVYMTKNPKLQSVWYVVPALKCLSDLKNGKSIGDAIKDLNPDDQLYIVDNKAYNIMRLVAALSESIRDSSGKQNWIKANNLATLFSDPIDKSLFFALLYQEMNYQPQIAGNTIAQPNFISPAVEQKISDLLNDISSNYSSTTDLAKAYKAIKDASAQGSAIDFDQLLTLTKGFETSIQKTWDDVNDLAPDPKYEAVIDSVFRDIPKMAEVIVNFKNKKYALGVMNTMLIINQYIRPKNFVQQPFKGLAILLQQPATTADIITAAQDVDLYVSNYYAAHPEDNLKALIGDAKAIEAFPATMPIADQQKALNKLFVSTSEHTFQLNSKDFDASNIYQQLLKYGILMASLSQAKTPDEAKQALDAAILPVGSSSIKYYSAFSFALNSYVGGAYYTSNYQLRATNSKLKFNTLGVALPIGVNFSVTTRSKAVGAVSLFASAIDLGAVASYRLSNPSNSGTQTLPAFTFQNLIAPGLFIVLNRIANTPLAVGFGAQRAPQLDSVTGTSAAISTDPKWRIGAFLSLDIPLFNLYSKSLKRPLN